MLPGTRLISEEEFNKYIIEGFYRVIYSVYVFVMVFTYLFSFC